MLIDTVLIALNKSTYCHILLNILLENAVGTNGALPIKNGKFINLFVISDAPDCKMQAIASVKITVLIPFLY